MLNVWGKRKGDQMQITQKITVTEENLVAVRGAISSDQAAELEPGCEAWPIYYGSGRQIGHMTRWPSGRGAVSFGADSEWGDWSRGLLETDEGSFYDEDGREIDPDAGPMPHGAGCEGAGQ